MGRAPIFFLICAYVNLEWNRPNAWHPLMENKGEREGGENLLRAQVEEGLEELNGFIHFNVLQ